MSKLLLETDRFVIYLNDSLSEYKRKILTFLYMPIIGQKATNLYTTLASFVKTGENESQVNYHNQLFKLLQIKKANDFIKLKDSLEAIGLLDTYYYQSNVDTSGLYLYFVKDVLDSYQFLNDPSLSQLLRLSIGQAAMDEVASQFLVHRYDISKFVKLTKSFDEVYQINREGEANTYQSWWVDTQNIGVNVKNKVFDFEYLMILLSALDVVNLEMIKTKTFYEIVNRYGFFYQLTAEDMKNAVVASSNVNREIDYEVLKKQVVRIYDNKKQGLKIEPIVTRPSTSTDNMINYLETLSPTEVVKGRTGFELTGAEIQIFDELMAKTGISLGVLNVLIIYVMTEKDGAIPSYNYFLRVINGWLRSGVKTTEDALKKLHKPFGEKTKTTAKKEKSVPGWYDEYYQETNRKIAEAQAKAQEKDISLEELEALFHSNKRKQ